MPIHLCPLAYALSLEASITNAYVEIIDSLELLSIIANKHNVCLLYNTCPFNKTFQQIYLILNSIDFIAAQYFTLHHLFIQEVNLIHINKFEMWVGSVDCSLAN